MPRSPIHVIVCGAGKIGCAIADYLLHSGVTTTVITLTTPTAPIGETPQAARVLIADARRPEVLNTAGLATAHAVICAINDPLINLATALTVRRLNATVRLVVRVFDTKLIEQLATALPQAVGLSTSALTAPVFAARAINGQTLATFALRDQPYRVAKVILAADSPLVGGTVAKVCDQFGCRPVALIPGAATAPNSSHRQATLLRGVNSHHVLAAGDGLVVVGSPEQTTLPQARSDRSDTSVLRYAGRLWRWLMALGEVLGEVRRALLGTVSVLVLVIASLSAVLYFGLDQSPIDSVYITVGILAGNGPDIDRAIVPDWVKLFTVATQLLGVALLGAFVTMLTDLVVSARLRRAFASGLVPEKGHILVAGLNNLGWRVVENLRHAGQTPVIIELDPNNRFVALADSHKVPVLIGNAADATTLTRAKLNGARAVLALTDNDLANLEIGLRVAQLHPTARRVVRIDDPALAEAFGQTADMGSVFTVAELSAPAFVSAAFDERVRAVFAVDEHVLLVTDLVVAPSETNLIGQAVSNLAATYDILPLALKPATATPTSPVNTPPDDKAITEPASIAAATLAVGDRLTVVTHRSELRRLQRDTQTHMAEVAAGV